MSVLWIREQRESTNVNMELYIYSSLLRHSVILFEISVVVS